MGLPSSRVVGAVHDTVAVTVNGVAVFPLLPISLLVPPPQAVMSKVRLSSNTVSVEKTVGWWRARVNDADAVLDMFSPFKFRVDVLKTVM